MSHSSEVQVSTNPARNASRAAVTLAIAICAGTAQADGGGNSMRGQPGVAPRGLSFQQSPAAPVPPPISPLGHNIAATIIRPTNNPIPFNPGFVAPAQPVFVTPPATQVIVTPVFVPVFVNPQPPVIGFPANPVVGSQVPSISPSAPVFIAPPTQTFATEPETEQVLNVRRRAF